MHGTRGRPPPPTPESTAEEGSSSSELNFSESEEYEVVTGASPRLAPRGAGGEGSPMALGEARLAPGLLVEASTTRAERRMPSPAAGQRSPVPAASRDPPSPAASG